MDFSEGPLFYQSDIAEMVYVRKFVRPARYSALWDGQPIHGMKILFAQHCALLVW